MNLRYSDHFQKKLQKRLRKHPNLKPKLAKQLKLLQQNIAHPSLKAHKLKGQRLDEYAIWIEGDLRVLFVMIEDGLLLTDLVTHDEY